jgi:hypothetical protein
MKQSGSFWLIAVFLLLIAGLAFVANECFQRMKFAILQDEVSAALQDFQSRAGPGRYDVIDVLESDPPDRTRTWVAIPAGKPTSPPHPPDWFRVDLVQSRTGILRPPRVQVYWVMGKDHSVEALIGSALSARGLSFETGILVE